jgi:hypothetical protein
MRIFGSRLIFILEREDFRREQNSSGEENEIVCDVVADMYRFCAS